MITMQTIQMALGKFKVAIDAKVTSGAMTQADVDKHSKTLDLDAGEHAHFQTLKSALMGSALDTEAAQYIYARLGQTPATFNAQPMHVKYVLTEVFAALISSKTDRR